MSSLIESEFPLHEVQRARYDLLQTLTDSDLAYKLPGDNPTLGVLCREIGKVEYSYIQSFKIFKCSMRETFQFLLNSTHHQRTLLYQTLELCRWVYNETLATRKNTWEPEQKSLTLYNTNKQLTGWKQGKPELAQLHSQAL